MSVMASIRPPPAAGSPRSGTEVLRHPPGGEPHDVAGVEQFAAGAPDDALPCPAGGEVVLQDDAEVVGTRVDHDALVVVEALDHRHSRSLWAGDEPVAPNGALGRHG